jgi:hypothetical protein
LTVKFTMVGVRFLDVDFMRINLACPCSTVYIIRLFCTVVGRSGRTHRDRNAGWRHRNGRQHGGAGREANLIFVLPSNVYVGPRVPRVGGTFYPGGSLEATRRSFNKDFLLALAADFKKHGAAAIEKVREQQPAAYLKICALLVPREMKLEHTGGVKAMTDEELEAALAILKEMIAKRDAAANAKVIEGVAEPVPALPPPSRKARRKVRRSD